MPVPVPMYRPMDVALAVVDKDAAVPVLTLTPFTYKVNDPELTVDETLAAVINDPSMTMDRNMVVRRRNGRDVIRRSGQFANLALGIDIKPQKRKRKKTKTDKTMKAALTQANKELRKKNGQLRKGVTQADIMRRAHRIRRKMS